MRSLVLSFDYDALVNILKMLQDVYKMRMTERRRSRKMHSTTFIY